MAKARGKLLNRRELATALAALRWLQRNTTAGGGIDIDDLCERLNFAAKIKDMRREDIATIVFALRHWESSARESVKDAIERAIIWDCRLKLLEEDEIKALCRHLDPLVFCQFCGKETPAATSHLRSDGWVGECCWDERLRD